MAKKLINIAFLTIFGLSGLGLIGCNEYVGANGFSCKKETYGKNIYAIKGDKKAQFNYYDDTKEINWTHNMTREEAIEALDACKKEFERGKIAKKTKKNP